MTILNSIMDATKKRVSRRRSRAGSGELARATQIKWSCGTYMGEVAVVDGELVAEGFGVFKFNNGDRYEGTWKDNMMHGFGIYTWTRLGREYEGSWLFHRQFGPGVLRLENGSELDGNFVDGELRNPSSPEQPSEGEPGTEELGAPDWPPDADSQPGRRRRSSSLSQRLRHRRDSRQISLALRRKKGAPALFGPIDGLV